MIRNYTYNIPNVPGERGIYTSEFLLTIVGVVAVVALVIFGGLDVTWAAGTIGTSTFRYAVSRGLAKR